jgi:hypothetical protein
MRDEFYSPAINFLLTVGPEVLANASDKLLWRLGFQSQITANLVEGYGYQGGGKWATPMARWPMFAARLMLGMTNMRGR